MRRRGLRWRQQVWAAYRTARDERMTRASIEYNTRGKSWPRRFFLAYREPRHKPGRWSSVLASGLRAGRHPVYPLLAAEDSVGGAALLRGQLHSYPSGDNFAGGAAEYGHPARPAALENFRKWLNIIRHGPQFVLQDVCVGPGFGEGLLVTFMLLMVWGRWLVGQL